MWRTFRPPPREDGARPDADRAGRGVARRGSATSPSLRLRAQIGQVASRRLWRQNVGTTLSVLLMAAARLAALDDRVAGPRGAVRVDEARVELRRRRVGRRVELVDEERADAAVRLGQ